MVNGICLGLLGLLDSSQNFDVFDFLLSVPNSPRLGPKVETIAHLIIIANDDAFGILQLSAPVVRVAENHVGPIINVTRTGGAFADVSVKFKAVPITAIAGV